MGSPAFKAEMRAEHARRGAQLDRFAGLEPHALHEERRLHWEEQLLKLAGVAGVDLTKLSPRKSHPDKALLAAALKLSTSVSNPWLAQRLAMGQPASASQFARRWLLRPDGLAAAQSLVSRVKT